VVPQIKLARRRIRRARGRPPDRMAGAWADLVSHARDLGIPVPTHRSRPAQARVLARAGALSREADDRVFAEAEPSKEAVGAYWEQVMRERPSARSEPSTEAPAVGAVQPATLVRRPGAD
jgi:hypothetical protein